jgi:hypothetical protein
MKKMGKTMSKAIGGHNLKATMVMALLAVLLLVALLVAVEPTATTSDRDGNPAIHETSPTGGASVTHDPYIDRHVEVVARLGGGRLR